MSVVHAALCMQVLALMARNGMRIYMDMQVRKHHNSQLQKIVGAQCTGIRSAGIRSAWIRSTGLLGFVQLGCVQVGFVQLGYGIIAD